MAYFAIGIPFSYFFAFTRELDIRGLWWGPALATLYITIMYNLIICWINWPELIAEIIEREEKEKEVRKSLEEKNLAKESQKDDYGSTKTN